MGYLQRRKGCRQVVFVFGYRNFRRSRYMQVSERLGGMMLPVDLHDLKFRGPDRLRQFYMELTNAVRNYGE